MRPNGVKQLPKRKHFASKLLRYGFVSFSILFFSLLIGVLGYMYFFNLDWVDGLYNASMILTGMGPVDIAPDSRAKLFASFYAIYSGAAFLSCIAVLFAPIVHRFLHKFHLDIGE
jgi:hypothetical protein